MERDPQGAPLGTQTALRKIVLLTTMLLGAGASRAATVLNHTQVKGNGQIPGKRQKTRKTSFVESMSNIGAQFFKSWERCLPPCVKPHPDAVYHSLRGMNAMNELFAPFADPFGQGKRQSHKYFTELFFKRSPPPEYDYKTLQHYLQLLKNKPIQDKRDAATEQGGQRKLTIMFPRLGNQFGTGMVIGAAQEEGDGLPTLRKRDTAILRLLEQAKADGVASLSKHQQAKVEAYLRRQGVFKRGNRLSQSDIVNGLDQFYDEYAKLASQREGLVLLVYPNASNKDFNKWRWAGEQELHNPQVAKLLGQGKKVLAIGNPETKIMSFPEVAKHGKYLLQQFEEQVKTDPELKQRPELKDFTLSNARAHLYAVSNSGPGVLDLMTQLDPDPSGEMAVQTARDGKKRPNIRDTFAEVDPIVSPMDGQPERDITDSAYMVGAYEAAGMPGVEAVRLLKTPHMHRYFANKGVNLRRANQKYLDGTVAGSVRNRDGTYGVNTIKEYIEMEGDDGSNKPGDDGLVIKESAHGNRNEDEVNGNPDPKKVTVNRYGFDHRNETEDAGPIRALRKAKKNKASRLKQVQENQIGFIDPGGLFERTISIHKKGHHRLNRPQLVH